MSTSLMEDLEKRERLFDALRDSKSLDFQGDLFALYEKLHNRGLIDQLYLTHRVVLEANRPAILMRNGRLTKVPTSSPFTSEIQQAKSVWEEAAKSIGRVEYWRDNDYYECGGTCFMVGENLVATNRHVVDRFLVFGKEAWITFDTDSNASFEVEPESIYIVPKPGPDLAFMSLKPSADKDAPDPLKLSAEPATKDDVIGVLGFPAFAGGCWAGIVDDVFPPANGGGKKFLYAGIKHLSPGQITLAEAGTLLHDASTATGSSGSPLLDLEGQVLGIHYDGKCAPLYANLAVPSALIEHHLSKSG